MSVRWRATGELVCGAKSGPRDGDTYIDDRLQYQLAVIERVLVPDDDEAESGLWRWRNEAPDDETFALAHPDRPQDVTVWAQPEADPAGGRGYFRCLNGGWSGWFDGSHVRLDCADPGEPIPALEVWRGVVPEDHSYGMRAYNEAIAWIEDQICRS